MMTNELEIPIKFTRDELDAMRSALALARGSIEIFPEGERDAFTIARSGQILAINYDPTPSDRDAPIDAIEKLKGACAKLNVLV
jgi:hypothetical protein